MLPRSRPTSWPSTATPRASCSLTTSQREHRRQRQKPSGRHQSSPACRLQGGDCQSEGCHDRGGCAPASPKPPEGCVGDRGPSLFARMSCPEARSSSRSLICLCPPTASPALLIETATQASSGAAPAEFAKAEAAVVPIPAF